jgi:hypothetical protein
LFLCFFPVFVCFFFLPSLVCLVVVLLLLAFA